MLKIKKTLKMFQETNNDCVETEKSASYNRNFDKEKTSSLIGKWKNNGEALEPKWRDGDTMPLLPFINYTEIYSKEKSNNDQGKHVPKHNLSNDSLDSTIFDTKRISNPNDYEEQRSVESKSESVDRYVESISMRNVEDSSKVNMRPSISLETEKESLLLKNQGFKNIAKLNTSNYRETFPTSSNNYEHELNDEEYLKPRPRKRRPPQNHEFALTSKEAPLHDKNILNSSCTGAQENLTLSSPLESASKRNESHSSTSKNADELKALLKMRERKGLSLSEALQYRNLTLADLLEGKEDVITALKSAEAEEAEEYIKKASRIMFNSLSKLPATMPPAWPLLRRSTVHTKSIEMLPLNVFGNTKAAVSSINFTSPSKENSANLKMIFDNLNWMQIYPEYDERTTKRTALNTSAPLQPKITTVYNTSTAITTSMQPSIFMDSASISQEDDNLVRMKNGRNVGTETLDEDEIMEFSDFTDFKKERNNTSPVWYKTKDKENWPYLFTNAKNDPKNKSQILSTEHKSNPVESMKNNGELSTLLRYNESFQENVPSKTNFEEQSIASIERSTKMYDMLIEYQGDSPLTQNSEKDDWPNVNTDESKMNMEENVPMKEKIQGTSNCCKTYGIQETMIPRTNEKKRNTSLENRTKTDFNGEDYKDFVSEIESEARAEIFELFSSDSAGKRLERVLKSRNMSVEELIALRQRGSSKIHLADALRLRIQKSNLLQTTENVSQNATNSTSATNVENRNDDVSKSRSKNKIVGNKVLNMNNSERQTNETVEGREGKIELKVSGILHYKGSNDADIPFSNINSNIEKEDRDSKTPSKGQSLRTEESGKEYSRHVAQTASLLTTLKLVPELIHFHEKTETKMQNHGEGMTIENNPKKTKEKAFQRAYAERKTKEPNSVDIRTVYANVKKDTENNQKSSAKIQPSMIASIAILAMTIIVFMAIFVVCKFRQKQKYAYKNTFSRAVFQGPTMAVRKLSNSSSLSTVMVNVAAMSTVKKIERCATQEGIKNLEPRSDIDNDSLDTNDSWETIPRYAK
ncbi:hypothetical protein KM043_006051 [Ampulex compressa]|nr:hypothetical protein KM043_006051 [Ampulex compressa]